MTRPETQVIAQQKHVQNSTLILSNSAKTWQWGAGWGRRWPPRRGTFQARGGEVYGKWWRRQDKAILGRKQYQSSNKYLEGTARNAFLRGRGLRLRGSER